jgi:hypothetical protein
MDEDQAKLTHDEALRLTCVDLAIKLTLQDEALFSGSTLSFASRIYKFVTTGVVEATPIGG